MYAARSFSGFVLKCPRSLFQIGNTVQKTPFSAAASFSIDLFAETLHQKMLGQLCTRARLDSHPVVTVWKDRSGEKFSVQWFLSKTSSCLLCPGKLKVVSVLLGIQWCYFFLLPRNGLPFLGHLSPRVFQELIHHICTKSVLSAANSWPWYRRALF